MESDEVREEMLRGRMLCIELGTRLQLQAGARGDDLKLTGVLIGMVPESFLIVSIPAIPGVLGKLVEGNQVTVRYMFAGGVYGFGSHVLGRVLKPALMLFLSYPRMIEVLDLRKAQRLVSLMPAQVQIGEDEMLGVVVDLSVGGCRLSIETEESDLPVLETGEALYISFQLTGLAGPQVIRGIVQTIRQDGKFAEVGIRFDENDTDAIMNVHAYLKSISKLQEHIPSMNWTVF
ncbi:MAG: flagellar brake protein [Syntrophobacteraceae bacterium]